jgi:Zn-dependent protease with chaperone function
MRSFLVHKARYNLYMLLAWVPFAFLADWLGEFMIVLPVLFLGAAWAFPLILARAWGCRRLPEGPVAESVRRLEQTAGVKFSRVYLWEPGGGNAQNAAAVGILPPFRYLFLTPALVRGMKGDELEAVILHELGHIRKKHLLFYLFTSLAGINFAVFAGLFLPLGSTERFILTVALVLGYFRFVFGWLSRNMERQADLFALEKTGSSRGLANALEKLGIAAGNIRLATSWHHLGIAERVGYLRRAEQNPVLMREHNAGVRRLMTAGYLASVLLVGAMIWLVHAEAAAGRGVAREGEAASIAAAREDRAHWRRVVGLMPDNAEAALELAHSLARAPGDRVEAIGLAARAMRLADRPEARDAAAKLLKDLDE